MIGSFPPVVEGPQELKALKFRGLWCGRVLESRFQTLAHSREPRAQPGVRLCGASMRPSPGERGLKPDPDGEGGVYELVPPHPGSVD